MPPPLSLSLRVSEAESVLWSSLSVRFDHHHPTATDSAQLSSLKHVHIEPLCQRILHAVSDTSK